ncbi:50S ribosomal protein L20 [Candidatus Nardonella dryophthoridicola]|uniref:Large ribosomal subunit protein bL20 n=1 Tax=endosymbiont of Rhynchophorus ferrugineus TaxID=1972133 RepID=A0A2Z5T7Y5_9GAMM|nr:50S ribosomal protein L20 [Candidatus Nardonella dryophthoridicola]QTJ62879.1 50S ribosomal protein L20 [Candidatus Nardonella dryophthoridicola]BBA85125.1 50S ribosomal protein L20 [endosymbiont of Rhynchophorus ferrugineus]
MIRSRPNVSSRNRRKKILKEAKGYYGARSKLFKTAKQSVIKSYQYSYIDRKKKKRNFRKNWIIRINAASRKYNINYSKLIYLLKKNNILINRKLLCNNIINNENYLNNIIKIIKN